MGIGYNFKCRQCGHEYGILLGVGGRFPTMYQQYVNEILSGAWGEKWKERLSSLEYAALDGHEKLYLCKSCHNWMVEPSLAIYLPNDQAAIDKSYFVDGSQSILFPVMLEWNYHFLASYVHKCHKCGKRMRSIEVKPQTELACPKCGHENTPLGKIMWD